MRMNRLLIIIVVLLFQLGFMTMVHASYEDRINAERNISSKAQLILDNMFGAHSFAVTSRISMTNESWSIRYTNRAKIKGAKAKKKQDTSYQILPGFSAIKNLAPDMEKMPFNSVITRKDPRVKKIILDIVVGSHITKKEARKASKVLMSVLQMKKNRGDAINLNFQKFPYVEKMMASDMDEELVPPLTPASHKFLLFLAILFIIIYTYLQLKFLKKSSGAGGSASGGAAQAPAAKPGASKPLSMSSSGSSSMKSYFDFVTEENVDAVVQILLQDKVPPEQLTNIISFLPGKVSAYLINQYPIEVQAKLLASVVDQRVVDKAALDSLEKKLKLKLECSIGGAFVIDQVFQNLAGDIKKKILKMIEKDPATYQKVRPNVILFDDIQYLSDDELKTVLVELNLENLSASIMGADSKTKAKVYKNLSPAAKAMVTQFEELKSKSVTKSDIDVAQSYVVEIVARMEKDQLIELKKKIPGVRKG